MSKNYAALAGSVVNALGGVDNIAAVTHCMTRLRFVVKDDAKIDSATLKGISGVMGVVRNDSQCQSSSAIRCRMPIVKWWHCCPAICSPLNRSVNRG